MSTRTKRQGVGRCGSNADAVDDLRGIVKFPEEAAKMPHIFLGYKGILWGSLHLAMIKGDSYASV